MSELVQETILDALHETFPEIQKKNIVNVLNMLEEGNTIPFIARYRKEMTNNLDEVEIKAIQDEYMDQCALKERKENVTHLIDKQGLLTPEISAMIMKATRLPELEDIYRPFRPKRKTKAMLAKEQGYDRLAQVLMEFPDEAAIKTALSAYPDAEAAANGAYEIIAEQVGETPELRQWVRNYAWSNGVLATSAKASDEDEKKVFEMYYNFHEAVNKLLPHRILAINRGEKEGILKVSLELNDAEILHVMKRRIVGQHQADPIVERAIADSYKRFINPAIEREIRQELTQKGQSQAIDVFQDNLRQLLLQPPLQGKITMGFDPAYRTGCKLAIVDQTGKLLRVAVIYPHPPASQQKQQEAGPLFLDLCRKYKVEIIAIGNGTASRESEQFVATQIKALSQPIAYAIVSEAGASVYSASEIARDEFATLPVEQRSAISIARRLQDPLAELVKIDSKSIGVGQYQHDVDQKKLQDRLDFVVETAVNQVGVNLNTASVQLLTHVSGLNKTLAANIVSYREQNGPFARRRQLHDVARLGDKAFEQAAGFLRIPEGADPLDNTGIHPESYGVASDLLKAAATDLKHADRDKLEAGAVQFKDKIGAATLADIIASLLNPGRDMRSNYPQPLLRHDVLHMEDIQVGMKFEGTVRNVVDFGAFVDIGVKQDGLVHLSRMSQRFIKHPGEVVKVNDIVTVWVTEIDLEKGRIGLSMKAPQS